MGPGIDLPGKGHSRPVQHRVRLLASMGPGIDLPGKVQGPIKDPDTHIRLQWGPG